MPDPRAARSRRPGRLTALVTALVAAVTVASGCSVIPSGNGPQAAAAPGPRQARGRAAGCLCGPRRWAGVPSKWSSTSCSPAPLAHNYPVAREYLTKPAIESWHPGVGDDPGQGTQGVHGRAGHHGRAGRQSVLVTGQELARLSSAGQYIAAPGGAKAPTEEFSQALQKGHPQDRRATDRRGKASRELLLTNDLFRLVYAPRNLYYLGGRNGTVVALPGVRAHPGHRPGGDTGPRSHQRPPRMAAGRGADRVPAESHLAGRSRCSPAPPAAAPRW